MSAALWLDEPAITSTDHTLTIEQTVKIGVLHTRISATVIIHMNGDVWFRNRDGDIVEIPAAWVTHINEFLVRSEVNAA